MKENIRYHKKRLKEINKIKSELTRLFFIEFKRVFENTPSKKTLTIRLKILVSEYKKLFDDSMKFKYEGRVVKVWKVGHEGFTRFDIILNKKVSLNVYFEKKILYEIKFNQEYSTPTASSLTRSYYLYAAKAHRSKTGNGDEKALKKFISTLFKVR